MVRLSMSPRAAARVAANLDPFSSHRVPASRIAFDRTRAHAVMTATQNAGDIDQGQPGQRPDHSSTNFGSTSGRLEHESYLALDRLVEAYLFSAALSSISKPDRSFLAFFTPS